MITIFLRLIATLNNLLLTQKFTFKSKSVLWEQYAPLHTQTYSYQSSKRDTSILSLKTNPETICALSKIFLWYEPNPRAIWKKCPKDDFVSKKVLEIAVSSATIEFNDGGNGLKPVFNDLGVNFGYFIKKGLNKKHNLRIRQSVRKSCDRGKVSRKRLRAITKNWTDKENQAEGVKPSYSTGRF